MEYSEGNELIEEHPLWKRIMIIIIGLFLLSLMFSYFLFSYPLFPIFESLLESRNSENNEISLDDFSIVFLDDILVEIQEEYQKNQKVEFAVCLLGEKNNENYNIKKVHYPEIYSQSFNHVSFQSCPDESLIILHSHPFRRCIASQQDIITLEETKSRNKDFLMVIMCEPNRFSVYE